ncbi:MAG TPA: hypothetical protein VF444_23940 [Pseudonocardiaceae bacterium]
MQHTISPHGFDVQALFDALDERCRREHLSWAGAAREMWRLSADLNALRGSDHPMSATTITSMAQRGDTTCQHALIMLRWLERAPEEFIAEPRPDTTGFPLPETDPAHRLRWDLAALYTALNDARLARKASWDQAANRLYCTANQLTGLRTAKFATGMRLAMRICQGLGRPAVDFIHPADW